MVDHQKTPPAPSAPPASVQAVAAPRRKGPDPLKPDFPALAFPVLPQCPFSRTLKGMEVHFSPDVETRLQQVALASGKDAEQLVKDTVARYLDEEGRFLAAVEKGIAAADRGEFIEEEEMDARLEAMFKP
jgi:predicted transcriptional regulator